MENRFIQVHTLTSYPAALLNRDDAGFAKRIPFGGATRTRISSQCLKRHWRTFTGERSLGSLDVAKSVRSRWTFERRIVAPLVEEGLPKELVVAATKEFVHALLGESRKAKKTRRAKEAKEAKDETKRAALYSAELKTEQVTILGRPEVAYVLSEVRDIVGRVDSPEAAADEVDSRIQGDAKKNLGAMAELAKPTAGLSAAMFGRMVTSDILSRTDAAVHVAHAMTVHEEATESDYFSAVDDLLQGEDGELGSGHINAAELTSGLYYGYVVVDVPLLVSNLTGCKRDEALAADRGMAAEVVERLIHTIATVSPGAKLGSTAPYARAHMVLVETGKAQPCSLANAFLRPVRQRPDVLAASYEALGRHIAELDEMYGADNERRFAGLGPIDRLGPLARVEGPGSLAKLSAWVRQNVEEG